jgi:hypothetical protein
MRFLAAGAACRCSFRSAEIFGAGKFVAGVIDHIVRRNSWRDIRPQLRHFDLHEDSGEDNESLEKIRGKHDPHRNQTERSFAGETCFRAPQRWFNRT